MGVPLFGPAHVLSNFARLCVGHTWGAHCPMGWYTISFSGLPNPLMIHKGIRFIWCSTYVVPTKAACQPPTKHQWERGTCGHCVDCPCDSILSVSWYPACLQRGPRFFWMIPFGYNHAPAWSLPEDPLVNCSGRSIKWGPRIRKKYCFFFRITSVREQGWIWTLLAKTVKTGV